MNIALAIMHLYPQAVPMTDFIVQDDSDGNGPYIAQWNMEDEQPTEEELEEAWAALNTVPPITLEQYKQEKIEYLTSLSKSELVSGFISVVTRDGIALEFGYSEKAQERFMKQGALLGADLEETDVQWLTSNYGFVILDRDEFISVMRSGAQHEKAIEFKLLYAEANIINAPTPEEVDAVVDSW